VAPTATYRDRLIESGLALSSELSISELLQRIVDLATEITEARYGALGVLGADGAITEFLTSGLTEEEREAMGPYPSGKGLLGALIEEARPMRLADLTTDPRSTGFPPDHPPMRSFLGAPVRARGRVFGNIYLTEKIGDAAFSAEDEEAVTVLAAQAGIAIENARQYEETRQRERSLDALRDITNAILRGARSAEVLHLITDRARELVGAELSSIAVPTADGRALVLEAASGAHADKLRGQTFPKEGSISGDVITSGTPAIIGDLSSDWRAFQPVVRLGEMGPSIFVPMTLEGRAFGTLSVSNLHRGMHFTDDDLKLIETFAAHAAVAVEYARLHEELQRLAVMEDRERIAKDLHDGAIQSLFAVGMGLEATGAMAHDEEVEARIDQAVQEIDRVIRDLRNYIFGLRPGILADRQLDQALTDLAIDFESRTGIVTAIDIEESTASELASRAGDLVQLTREALSNIGRHAGAETCSVRLHRHEDVALLEIDDDGRGFDTEEAAGGDGNGLRNIRERAALLGGVAEVGSSPDGTMIRVTVPLT
jgi:signal transduction histidine kinase